MGKNKKEHRRKVAKRNAKIKQQKDSLNRAKEKFIMNLIREAEDRKAAEHLEKKNVNEIEKTNNDTPLEEC